MRSSVWGKVLMKTEIWDLYDARGFKTGETMRRGEEIPRGRYHIGVHIWPVNKSGELLIQRRSMRVQWKPGLWAATGGSAVRGEGPLEAAQRELREELGVRAAPEEMKKVTCLRRTNSFCNVYLYRTDLAADEFILQAEEVSEVRWCLPGRIRQMVGEGTLYNYGDLYFRTLFEYCGKEGLLRIGRKSR